MFFDDVENAYGSKETELFIALTEVTAIITPIEPKQVSQYLLQNLQPINTYQGLKIHQALNSMQQIISTTYLSSPPLTIEPNFELLISLTTTLGPIMESLHALYYTLLLKKSMPILHPTFATITTYTKEDDHIFTFIEELLILCWSTMNYHILIQNSRFHEDDDDINSTVVLLNTLLQQFISLYLDYIQLLHPKRDLDNIIQCDDSDGTIIHTAHKEINVIHTILKLMNDYNGTTGCIEDIKPKLQPQLLQFIENYLIKQPNDLYHDMNNNNYTPTNYEQYTTQIFKQMKPFENQPHFSNPLLNCLLSSIAFIQSYMPQVISLNNEDFTFFQQELPTFLHILPPLLISQPILSINYPTLSWLGDGSLLKQLLTCYSLYFSDSFCTIPYIYRDNITYSQTPGVEQFPSTYTDQLLQFTPEEITIESEVEGEEEDEVVSSSSSSDSDSDSSSSYSDSDSSSSSSSSSDSDSSEDDQPIQKQVPPPRPHQQQQQRPTIPKNESTVVKNCRLKHNGLSPTELHMHNSITHFNTIIRLLPSYFYLLRFTTMCFNMIHTNTSNDMDWSEDPLLSTPLLSFSFVLPSTNLIPLPQLNSSSTTTRPLQLKPISNFIKKQEIHQKKIEYIKIALYWSTNGLFSSSPARQYLHTYKWELPHGGKYDSTTGDVTESDDDNDDNDEQDPDNTTQEQLNDTTNTQKLTNDPLSLYNQFKTSNEEYLTQQTVHPPLPLIHTVNDFKVEINIEHYLSPLNQMTLGLKPIVFFHYTNILTLITSTLTKLYERFETHKLYNMSLQLPHKSRSFADFLFYQQYQFEQSLNSTLSNNTTTTSTSTTTTLTPQQELQLYRTTVTQNRRNPKMIHIESILSKLHYSMHILRLSSTLFQLCNVDFIPLLLSLVQTAVVNKPKKLITELHQIKDTLYQQFNRQGVKFHTFSPSNQHYLFHLSLLMQTKTSSYLNEQAAQEFTLDLYKTSTQLSNQRLCTIMMPFITRLTSTITIHNSSIFERIISNYNPMMNELVTIFVRPQYIHFTHLYQWENRTPNQLQDYLTTTIHTPQSILCTNYLYYFHHLFNAATFLFSLFSAHNFSNPPPKHQEYIKQLPNSGRFPRSYLYPRLPQDNNNTNNNTTSTTTLPIEQQYFLSPEVLQFFTKNYAHFIPTFANQLGYGQQVNPTYDIRNIYKNVPMMSDIIRPSYRFFVQVLNYIQTLHIQSLLLYIPTEDFQHYLEIAAMQIDTKYQPTFTKTTKPINIYVTQDTLTIIHLCTRFGFGKLLFQFLSTQFTMLSPKKEHYRNHLDHNDFTGLYAFISLLHTITTKPVQLINATQLTYVNHNVFNCSIPQPFHKQITSINKHHKSHIDPESLSFNTLSFTPVQSTTTSTTSTIQQFIPVPAISLYNPHKPIDHYTMSQDGQFTSNFYQHSRQNPIFSTYFTSYLKSPSTAFILSLPSFYSISNQLYQQSTTKSLTSISSTIPTLSTTKCFPPQFKQVLNAIYIENLIRTIHGCCYQAWFLATELSEVHPHAIPSFECYALNEINKKAARNVNNNNNNNGNNNINLNNPQINLVFDDELGQFVFDDGFQDDFFDEDDDDFTDDSDNDDTQDDDDNTSDDSDDSTSSPSTSTPTVKKPTVKQYDLYDEFHRKYTTHSIDFTIHDLYRPTMVENIFNMFIPGSLTEQVFTTENIPFLSHKLPIQIFMNQYPDTTTNTSSTSSTTSTSTQNQQLFKLTNPSNPTRPYNQYYPYESVYENNIRVKTLQEIDCYDDHYTNPMSRLFFKQTIDTSPIPIAIDLDAFTTQYCIELFIDLLLLDGDDDSPSTITTTTNTNTISTIDFTTPTQLVNYQPISSPTTYQLPLEPIQQINPLTYEIDENENGSLFDDDEEPTNEYVRSITQKSQCKPLSSQFPILIPTNPSIPLGFVQKLQDDSPLIWQQLYQSTSLPSLFTPAAATTTTTTATRTTTTTTINTNQFLSLSPNSTPSTPTALEPSPTLMNMSNLYTAPIVHSGHVVQSIAGMVNYDELY